MRVAVEQVIQTATKVLDGQLTGREAVTILATLTPQAVPAARKLRSDDPAVAASYQELILVIGRELREREAGSGEANQIRAITDDLSKVLRALE